MFLGDLHTHSLCSPDGAFSMLDMARSAQKAGLTYLCVTDHCDLLDLNGVFTLDYDHAPCREEFQRAVAGLPQGLTLGRGIELGEAYERPDVARAILSDAPELDFVIGSVHNFSRVMGKQDFYNADYKDPAMCHTALDDYLDSLLALSQLPECYDALAHILYPLRYMHRAGQDVSLAQRDYPERLNVILGHVAQAGKALEVNTWRGRTVSEWEPLLRQFKAQGGEYVTVGSDAHHVQDVGKGVAAAYELMKTCGFRYTAIYQNRRPIMEAI